MTDHTAGGGPIHRSAGPPWGEFRVYFGLIVVLGLPVAALTWTAALLREGRLPAKGPIARAWSQAREITPFIFQG